MSKVFRRSFRPSRVHTLGCENVFKAVLLGPPGAHKWKLGEKLAETFKLSHVPVRERININIEKDSKFGQLAKQSIDKGVMIPNKITMTFITKEILEAEVAGKSWVISGFPVTETQASLFWSHVKLHMAIHVTFPEDVMVQNLIKRHQSGKSPGKDVDNKTLERIQTLLDNYTKISKPMLSFYTNHNILHSFYSNTFDSMWKKVKKSVDDVCNVSTDDKLKN